MRAINVLISCLLIALVICAPTWKHTVANEDVVWVYVVSLPPAVHSVGAITPHIYVWNDDQIAVSSYLPVLKTDKYVLTRST